MTYPLPCELWPRPSLEDSDQWSILLNDLLQCRQGTLDLVTGLDEALIALQAHPAFSPIGWHLGHIAFTESLWILERLAGQSRPYPQYTRLFSADGLPKAERQNLPPLGEIQSYLASIRQQVLAYLHDLPDIQQHRLWSWLIQHESQHGETIALLMAVHRTHGRDVPLRKPAFPGIDIQASAGSILPQKHLPEMVHIPEGLFPLGNESVDAFDNERPVHEVMLKAYWIDRTPVTCGQYRDFIEAGGYQSRTWWSEDGWNWLQASQVTAPLYWLEDDALGQHPVSGVSGYEADAYARFVGKRLPTEAEWEKAASWHPQKQISQEYPWGETQPTLSHCNHNHIVGHTSPIGQFTANVSPLGCYDMLGNVWEWTSSWFAGYAGFAAYPYRGYSEVYFDQAHRVLKGGSWATRPWVLRNSFRNWYHPHVRELFMGFRCASDQS